MERSEIAIRLISPLVVLILAYLTNSTWDGIFFAGGYLTYMFLFDIYYTR